MASQHEAHRAANVAGLPVAIRPAVQELAQRLNDLADRSLLGLTVYGPVVHPSGAAARAAVTTAAVFEQVDLDLLLRLGEQGPALGRMGVLPPLVLTPAAIADSLDTFPLEFLEIQQFHATVLGPDYFAGLTLRHEELRLQAEREFRRVLLRMRQGILAAGGREHLLSRLVPDVAAHLLRTLRGLVWLRGKTDPLPADQVLLEVERLVAAPLPAVREAVADKRFHDWAEFQSLYGEVERLASLANDAG